MRIIEGMKLLWKKNKLKKRLMIYFLSSVLIMGLSNVYPYFSMGMLMGKLSIVFEVNLQLNDLTSTLSKLHFSYQEYLESKYSERLDEYYMYSTELKNKASMLKIDSRNQYSLNIKNIKNMITSYLEETDAAVTSRRNREFDEYLSHYNESKKINLYINESIEKLQNIALIQNTESYEKIKRNSQLIKSVNIFITYAVLLLNIVMVLWYIHIITKPISQLSSAADEIAQGNFGVERIVIEADDELSTMADAFNRMADSIRNYIGEIKEKADLESKLRQQKLEYIEMESNIKDATLSSIKNQISPQFLYTTLNSGAQLAMIEGAERTCLFIQKAAELLRYNLINLDKSVTIREELTSIEIYGKLLKARFADKVEISICHEESVLDVKIPCMVIQPIVENAFVHGIGQNNESGCIWVKAICVGQNVRISIKDNGRGMTTEIINDIFEGLSGGNGLSNIIKRLTTFYGIDNMVKINSDLENGTEVEITIPNVVFEEL